MGGTKRKLVALATALLIWGLCAQPLSAQDRTHLLGDWGGVRSKLAEHGIIFDFQVTQFYQGVVDGSSDNNWKYGVKGDYKLIVDGEKAGLWKGLFLDLHVETRAGDDVNGLTGLSPANTAMLWPNGDDVTALTHAVVFQFLNEQFSLVGGKVNALDFADLVFHTGRGIDGFMNTSLVLPLGLGRSTGLAIPVGGFMTWKGKEVQGAGVVYDPNDCATTSCLDPLFEDTAGLFIWKFFTGSPREGVREGYIAFGGTYSGKDYTVVSPGSFFVNPAEGVFGFAETQNTWSVVSIIDQPLWADPLDANRDVRFKGMYTITDGEANPIHWSATAALEVNGPIRSRDKDVLGIGYFHSELSSGFKDAVGPLLSLAATLETMTPTRIAIEDTDGFEAYYLAQLTPWFALTADLQVITETLSTNDTKLVTGLRGKATF